MTRKEKELFAKMADLMCDAEDRKILLVAWEALRHMRPHGRLSRAALPSDPLGDLQEIRRAIWRDLDRGVPYTQVAKAWVIDWRRIRRYQEQWARLSEEMKTHHREQWAREDEDRYEHARELAVKYRLQRLEQRRKGEDAA